MSKQKPIWNKKQVEAVKKYLQSKEFAETMKKFDQEQEERERKEKQEFMEWWLKNKDIPYMITV